MTVVQFNSSDLNGPHRALTDLIGPNLTSSESGLSPHRTLCHPIGTEDFHLYVRLLTACQMTVGLRAGHTQ